MLKCEDRSVETRDAIIEAARQAYIQPPHRCEFIFEHGQWYVSCLDCGAQWAVNDAEGPGSYNGFDFEQVTPPDERYYEYCAEEPLDYSILDERSAD